MYNVCAHVYSHNMCMHWQTQMVKYILSCLYFQIARIVELSLVNILRIQHGNFLSLVLLQFGYLVVTYNIFLTENCTIMCFAFAFVFYLIVLHIYLATTCKCSIANLYVLGFTEEMAPNISKFDNVLALGQRKTGESGTTGSRPG